MQILRRFLGPADTAYDSDRLGGSSAASFLLAATAAATYLPLLGTAADSSKLGGTAAASFLLSSTAASTYQTQAAMSAYQLALVSGTTIKTVGGVSLLGSGDVSVGVGDMLLGTAQEITAAKTFDVDTLVLKGSSSGTSTLNAAATAGTTTFTLPGSSGTIALTSDIPSLSGYLTSATAASTYLALSGGTLTGALAANAGLTLGGNISASAWGLTGVKLKGGTSTLTDTSSSGTVATGATNALGGNTIAASNATTITDYYSLYLALPVAGSNVTLTNRWSLGLEGALKATAATLTGGALTLNGATSGASVLAAPAVAGSATITLPGVTSTLATLGANTFTALQTVSLTNATDKLALQGAIYDVRVYGAKCDGTTDDSTAVQAAITAACNAAGGVIYFPAMTRVDSQLVIPNDAASPAPHQVPLLFKGSGSHWKGIASPIKGGGGLDLRYAGTVGKIVSYGLGLLAFEDMTFTNGGTDSLPFVYVTNTTVLASRNSFIGASAASPLQDAFVLGGQGASVTGDSTGYFQGYGTVIERNYFDYINRGVLLQKNANAVVIRDNSWWTNCAGSAAIEDWNNSGNGIQGVMTSGNLIEMNGYTYGIAWHYAGKSVMVGDTFYDGGSFTSYYYFGNSKALPACVIPGFYATAAKLASGSYYPSFGRADAAGSHSLLDSTGAYTNSILKVGRVELYGNRMVFRAANNDEVFHVYTSTHNLYWAPQQSDSVIRFRDNASNDILTFSMPDSTFVFKNTKASTGYTYWETQAGAGQSTIPMGRWKDTSGNTNTTIAADGTFKFTGATTFNWLANGQSCNFKSLTELTTIAAAATTSTAIQLPPNALIISVSVRVTTAVTCTSTFTVGDGGSAARYSTAAVSKAAGSTDPGTKAGIYYNATATPVVITPDTTPSDNTGRVRVTINYIDVTPPTS